MTEATGPRGEVRSGGRLAASALRASVGTSARGATCVILAGLTVSWAAVLVMGGAGEVVPHFYYFAILFSAVRFGLPTTVLIALASGVLAGPLTPLDVTTGAPQETVRWVTRAVFFLVIGAGMAGMVRPSLPGIGEELRRRRDERLLRDALARGEFFVRYQPIVRGGSRSIATFEALVRWQHPEHGELAPSHFLHLAEESDVIDELGTFVLTEACRTAARWAAAAEAVGDVAPRVSVNLSGRELNSPWVVARVHQVLEETGLDPDRLWLEVTESVLVDDYHASSETLAKLKALGTWIAIDDFGTGYSSLSALRHFTIDLLKVDRALVAALDEGPHVGNMLRGLVRFADTLGVRTVAEGVESGDQAESLTELGYDYLQGHHFGSPMTREQVGSTLCGPASSRDPADAVENGPPTAG